MLNSPLLRLKSMGIPLVVTYCPKCKERIVVPKAVWYTVLGILSNKSNLSARDLVRQTRRSPRGLRSSLKYLREKELVKWKTKRLKNGKKRFYYTITHSGRRELLGPWK